MIRPRHGIERESCLEVLAEIVDLESASRERRQVHDSHLFHLARAGP
jgi:hypothetical protein